MFDELNELELMELIDEKNELLNELEYDSECGELDDVRREEIHDRLNEIYTQIDLLEGMD